MKKIQPQSRQPLTLAKETVKDLSVRTAIRAGIVQTVSCVFTVCKKF